MDNVDRASQQEADMLAESLRHRAPEGPPATGNCYYCEVKLPDAMRWCDAPCRDAWLADVRRANR